MSKISKAVGRQFSLHLLKTIIILGVQLEVKLPLFRSAGVFLTSKVTWNYTTVFVKPIILQGVVARQPEAFN